MRDRIALRSRLDDDEVAVLARAEVLEATLSCEEADGAFDFGSFCGELGHRDDGRSGGAPCSVFEASVEGQRNGFFSRTFQ